MTERRTWKIVRGIIVGVMVFAWMGSASAQSLAEVAKKEKERRAKSDEGSTKVITDRELASGYGGLPATTPRPSARTNTQDATAEGQTESAGEEDGDEVDERETREYWQTRVNGVKEKIARFEEQIQSDDWGDGQRYGVDPLGRNNLGRRAEAEQNLTAARAELEALREEARRSGVPAGWVR